MAKYFKFTYDGGYIGSGKTAIFKFPDDALEDEAALAFEDWYDRQREDHGDFEEISPEEAIAEGVDEEWE